MPFIIISSASLAEPRRHRNEYAPMPGNRSNSTSGSPIPVPLGDEINWHESAASNPLPRAPPWTSASATAGVEIVVRMMVEAVCDVDALARIGESSDARSCARIRRQKRSRSLPVLNIAGFRMREPDDAAGRVDVAQRTTHGLRGLNLVLAQFLQQLAEKHAIARRDRLERLCMKHQCTLVWMYPHGVSSRRNSVSRLAKSTAVTGNLKTGRRRSGSQAERQDALQPRFPGT